MKANVSDCLIIQSLTAWCCLLPQKHLSVLRRCGCCWPAHMQTGTGKTAVEWRSNCCRGHTSGERPHRQRKDQSEIFFKKKDNKTVTGSNKNVRIMAQHWAQNYRSFAWFTDLKKSQITLYFIVPKFLFFFWLMNPSNSSIYVWVWNCYRIKYPEQQRLQLGLSVHTILYTMITLFGDTRHKKIQWVGVGKEINWWCK